MHYVLDCIWLCLSCICTGHSVPGYLSILGLKDVHRLPVVYGPVQFHYPGLHVRHSRNAEVSGVLLHFLG